MNRVSVANRFSRRVFLHRSSSATLAALVLVSLPEQMAAQTVDTGEGGYGEGVYDAGVYPATTTTTVFLPFVNKDQ